jgi:hypothetical protein
MACVAFDTIKFFVVFNPMIGLSFEEGMGGFASNCVL